MPFEIPSPEIFPQYFKEKVFLKKKINFKKIWKKLNFKTSNAGGLLNKTAFCFLKSELPLSLGNIAPLRINPIKSDKLIVSFLYIIIFNKKLLFSCIFCLNSC